MLDEQGVCISWMLELHNLKYFWDSRILHRNEFWGIKEDDRDVPFNAGNFFYICARQFPFTLPDPVPTQLYPAEPWVGVATKVGLHSPSLWLSVWFGQGVNRERGLRAGGWLPGHNPLRSYGQPHPWTRDLSSCKTTISAQPSLLLGFGNIPSSFLFRCRYWPLPTSFTWLCILNIVCILPSKSFD